MSTNCLNLMDLLNLNQTESDNYLFENYLQSLKISSKNNYTCIAPTNKTISTRLYSQLSSRRQTQETGYRSIAYSQQIQRNEQIKQKYRSITLTPNMDQMQQSFEKMEQKMNKFQQDKLDIIDQKYMITGFLQISQDYQNIFQVMKKQCQYLNNVLKQYHNKNYEQTSQIDQYFQKNSQLLNINVQKYYKIKESFYRFLRMGIQEPYKQRVQNKIDQLEQQNHLYEYFQFYIELFRFINNNAIDCFQKDLINIHNLKESYTQLNFGQSFYQQVQEFKNKIVIISSTKEGSILNQIFYNKIDEIEYWIQLILKMANFKYVYQIKYLLYSKSQLKKIMKSKKLYDKIMQLLQKGEQYQINISNLNIFYKNEISKFVNEFYQIKSQIILWNVHLREDQLCQQTLILFKMNMKLKIVNKHLLLLFSQRESKNFDQEHLSSELIKIKKWKQQLYINSLMINQIKQTPEIKNDEYIQYQYNKFIILKDYFQNLLCEFDIS